MDSQRKRNRPPVSCSLCRKRKIRCNRELPCNNCLKSRSGTCTYDQGPTQTTKHRSQHDSSSNASNTKGQNQASPFSIPSVETSSTQRESDALTNGNVPRQQPLKNRLLSSDDLRYGTTGDPQVNQKPCNDTTRPDERLSDQTKPMFLTSESRMAGTFHTWQEQISSSHTQVIHRGIMHKSRLFGLSHFANGFTLFQDVLRMVEPHIKGDAFNIFSNIKKCKQLSKTIKSQREPQWPLTPSTELPSKEIADELVNCYLRTFESVYRVLHIPTFKKEYESIWSSKKEADMSFLVQVKLVLAIGAVTYDEHFSLRKQAVRWVFEAHSWLSQPHFKMQLRLQTIQNNILLLLAREAARVGHSLIWTSLGTLLRTAIYVGLHRDPLHLQKQTKLSAELRRRLWNTILELTLQSSMTSGGPALISIEDFDTEPPQNFDDEQLLDDTAEPRPEDQFTDSSVAIALRKSFAVRLAITKFLNIQGSNLVYEEVLKLDAEFRTAYKSLRQTLHSDASRKDKCPSRFQVGMVDFIMHRYLSSVHTPFFGLALQETAYAFSRRVVTESALKLWSAVSPSWAAATSEMPIDGSTTNRNDLARLILCSSGFFRMVAVQAIVLIQSELRAQLREENSLGPALVRSDLLSVTNDALKWWLRCIETGETNVKGFVGISMIAAHIEALRQDAPKDSIPLRLAAAMEKASETCLSMLESQAEKGKGEDIVMTADDTTLDLSQDLLKEWDFLLSDTIFNFMPANAEDWMPQPMLGTDF